MTEDEAKTKWCPFSRVEIVDGHGGVSGGNRGGGITSCIGSACMAWRWESDDDYEVRVAAWEDAANIGGISQRGPEPIRGGHCGLAGRP